MSMSSSGSRLSIVGSGRRGGGLVGRMEDVIDDLYMICVIGKTALQAHGGASRLIQASISACT